VVDGHVADPLVCRLAARRVDVQERVDGIVGRHRPLVCETHERRVGDALADRGDPEQGVGRKRRRPLGITPAVGPLDHDLAVACDAERPGVDPALCHVLEHHLVEARQPVVTVAGHRSARVALCRFGRRTRRRGGGWRAGRTPRCVGPSRLVGRVPVAETAGERGKPRRAEAPEETTAAEAAGGRRLVL